MSARLKSMLNRETKTNLKSALPKKVIFNLGDAPVEIDRKIGQTGDFEITGIAAKGTTPVEKLKSAFKPKR